MLKVVIDALKSIKAQDRQQQIKQMLPGGSAFSRKYFKSGLLPVFGFEMTIFDAEKPFFIAEIMDVSARLPTFPFILPIKCDRKNNTSFQVFKK